MSGGKTLPKELTLALIGAVGIIGWVLFSNYPGIGHILVQASSGNASLVESLCIAFIALCPLPLGAGIGGIISRNVPPRKNAYTTPKIILLALIILYVTICIVGTLFSIPWIVSLLVSLLFNPASYLATTLLCVSACIAVRHT